MNRPRRITALGVTAILLLAPLASGCDAVDELLGRGKGAQPDRLELQSIAISTDHPVDPEDPSGPAVASSGQTVQFIATGIFFNLDQGNAELEQEVTSAVLWESSNPALFPGSDGRIAIADTSGTAVISASSPAVGEIPAFESNAITLTVQ